MKIYIAGKISGIEDKAFELFENAEKKLLSEADGFLSKKLQVVNPMKLPHNHDRTWEAYMKECIKALVECEAVYLLNNWKESRGAKIEVSLAESLNLRIIKQQK